MSMTAEKPAIGFIGMGDQGLLVAIAMADADEQIHLDTPIKGVGPDLSAVTAINRALHSGKEYPDYLVKQHKRAIP